MIKVWPPIVLDFERLARYKGLSLVKLRGEFLNKEFPTYRDRRTQDCFEFYQFAVKSVK